MIASGPPCHSRSGHVTAGVEIRTVHPTARHDRMQPSYRSRSLWHSPRRSPLPAAPLRELDRAQLVTRVAATGDWVQGRN